VSTNLLLRSFLAAGTAAGLLAACGGDEPTGNDNHTPERYEALIDGQSVNGPLMLTAGQTVRVQLKFFNADDEDLDAVEGSHFARLTFSPLSLATATRVAGHNYQFDVTGGSEGTGSVVVGFGHSEAADEHTFPAETVIVEGEGGGGNPL
jgi:hypothetical protein